MSVGIRLKEERKRLGLTQEAMGLACGVAKRTQILFEQDAHLPGGAYFVAADELGVDVTYVLVGRRERLAEADADLLDAWRSGSVALEEYVAGSTGPSGWPVEAMVTLCRRTQASPITAKGWITMPLWWAIFTRRPTVAVA